MPNLDWWIAESTNEGEGIPEETWITPEQLREIEIVDPDDIIAVSQIGKMDDLTDLIGRLTDEKWLTVFGLYSHHCEQVSQSNARDTSAIHQYELSRADYSFRDMATYAEWQDRLTPKQQEIVNKPIQFPIRVKGGPGTGKTLTAIIRAAKILTDAQRQGEPIHVGFFVLDRDLGQTLYMQALDMGLEPFLLDDSNQQLTITSLMEWCEDFLRLDTYGIEPIAPYRTERMDKNRQALFDITIKRARDVLAGAEYEPLWAEFDLRSKNGLREIETELSQFIKGYDISSLSDYLNQRRETPWVGKHEKEFRRFVWEVYQIYNTTLRDLSMIDADDLVNDSLRQVQQSVWQNYRKQQRGFDYIIVDEAHDFFRNQLYLISGLVKNDHHLMMCFDEGQMVYSRYPTLREMGDEAGGRFFIRRLEINFRNSRQILAALQALVAAYPVYDYNSYWGTITPSMQSSQGPKPIATGFQSDTGMFERVISLVNQFIEQGIDSREIAVISFDEGLLRQAGDYIGKMLSIKLHYRTGQGKSLPRHSIVLTTGKHAKGGQFEVCILIGTDRDSLPDLQGGRGELWIKQKTEDDFREFAVAISRCKRHLYFVWAGTQPSEFIVALGDTVKYRG